MQVPHTQTPKPTSRAFFQFKIIQNNIEEKKKKASKRRNKFHETKKFFVQFQNRSVVDSNAEIYRHVESEKVHKIC
jgi:hypothetical protein